MKNNENHWNSMEFIGFLRRETVCRKKWEIPDAIHRKCSGRKTVCRKKWEIPDAIHRKCSGGKTVCRKKWEILNLVHRKCYGGYSNFISFSSPFGFHLFPLMFIPIRLLFPFQFHFIYIYFPIILSHSIMIPFRFISVPISLFHISIIFTIIQIIPLIISWHMMECIPRKYDVMEWFKSI